jgi:hypothetical protein
MATFPTDAAARRQRATLSSAVDHTPCALATPQTALIIIAATAACIKQRVPPGLRDAPGTETAAVVGTEERAVMTSQTNRNVVQY